MSPDNSSLTRWIDQKAGGGKDRSRGAEGWNHDPAQNDCHVTCDSSQLKIKKHEKKMHRTRANEKVQAAQQERAQVASTSFS